MLGDIGAYIGYSDDCDGGDDACSDVLSHSHVYVWSNNAIVICSDRDSGV